jgi:hypothetical protein
MLIAHTCLKIYTTVQGTSMNLLKICFEMGQREYHAVLRLFILLFKQQAQEDD